MSGQRVCVGLGSAHSTDGSYRLSRNEADPAPLVRCTLWLLPRTTTTWRTLAFCVPRPDGVAHVAVSTYLVLDLRL
jgi:hypothetical protein